MGGRKFTASPTSSTTSITRKTVLYWQQKISEAGWDLIDVARLSEHRRGWKNRMGKRIEHFTDGNVKKEIFMFERR